MLENRISSEFAVALPAGASSTPSHLFDSVFLSKDERKALQDAMLPPKIIGAGCEITRERERAGSLHIIIDGWACRYKTTRDGSRQILALLTCGDVANLDSTLFGFVDYGVRAFTATRIATIPRERMLTLIQDHVGISRTLAWLAMVENATLSRWVLRLGRQTAPQQLAHLLCEIHSKTQMEPGPGSGAAEFDLPLNQEEIADILGLTSVHVSRTLQQLRTAGLITTKGRFVSIRDIAALRQFGEFDDGYLHIKPAPFGQDI